MTLEISGTITVPGAESLQSTGSDLADFTSASGGTLVNYGTMTLLTGGSGTGINTADEPDPSALLENYGTFSVSGLSGALGVNFATVKNSGSFTVSSGGSATGATGGLVNTGTFQVSGASAIGIDTYNPGGWGALVQNLAGGVFTVKANASAAGVEMNNGGEFDNAGTMTITGSSTVYGVYMDRAEMGYSASYGLITNSGSITVNGAGSVAIMVSGLTNSLPSGDYNIINSGTITAQTAIEFFDPGYSPPQSVEAAIENSGTINGSIVLNNNSDTIFNTGVISGNISFGDGDDTINSANGTISGTITLGAGDDNVILGAENDTIYAGVGNNTIDGGGGYNTVIFSDFDKSKVTLKSEGQNTWLLDAGGVTDTLKNIQELQFSNGTVDLVQVIYDLIGAGTSDTLIESSSGALLVGELSSGQFSYTEIATLPPGWSIEAVGYFLGDGKSEFLLENTSGALLAGEVVNGQVTYTQIATLPAGWAFEGAGDFGGIGTDSFLLEETSTGALLVGTVVSGVAQYAQVAVTGSAAPPGSGLRAR